MSKFSGAYMLFLIRILVLFLGFLSWFNGLINSWTSTSSVREAMLKEDEGPADTIFVGGEEMWKWEWQRILPLKSRDNPELWLILPKSNHIRLTQDGLKFTQTLARMGWSPASFAWLELDKILWILTTLNNCSPLSNVLLDLALICFWCYMVYNG